MSEPILDDKDVFLLNDIFDDMHQASVKAGWWDDCTEENLYLVVPTKIALAHSELSEALEGFRKDLMDDKLPTRKMIEVELADAVIRIGDLAGKLGLDVGGAIREKMEYNKSREDHKLATRSAIGGKKF